MTGVSPSAEVLLCSQCLHFFFFLNGKIRTHARAEAGVESPMSASRWLQSPLHHPVRLHVGDILISGQTSLRDNSQVPEGSDGALGL